jgi:hypothetical protein
MASDESNDKPSFADLMTGVKKITDDRVNIYRDRAKKTALPGHKSQPVESSLDFSKIAYHQQSNISDTQFNSGMQKKLERKNCNAIILNSMNEAGAGFGKDTNKIYIIANDHKPLAMELKPKKEVAIDICDYINKQISLEDIL